MMRNNKPNIAPATRARAAVPAKADTVKTKSVPPKPDPRKVPPPTGPASVAVKAAEAIAPALSVATAEPKRAGPPKPSSRAKVPPEETKPATKAVPPLVSAAVIPTPLPELAAASRQAVSANGPHPTKVDEPGVVAKLADRTGMPLAKDAAESTTAMPGLAELNAKVLDLWRAQGEAAIDLWQSTVSAGSLAEAVRAQTSGFRKSYETNMSRWKDIAETASRVMGAAAQSVQSAVRPR